MGVVTIKGYTKLHFAPIEESVLLKKQRCTFFLIKLMTLHLYFTKATIKFITNWYKNILFTNDFITKQTLLYHINVIHIHI